jgi:A/G-specific adenine glycosylase
MAVSAGEVKFRMTSPHHPGNCQRSMSSKVSHSFIKKFQQEILGYYKKHGRPMPWRETDDPYKIFVSEIMLQQTQVSRVEEKYAQFISAFPDFAALDGAPLSKVYAVWQGMGYNRRALSLKKAANIVMAEHRGILPATEDALQSLPGIGKATASSIMAFAFDSPVAFIETNIRTVFIQFFFHKKSKVTDDEILPLVEKCLYKKSPRVWYWALMDYGTMLKKTGHDKNGRSAHYVKQTRFEGSRRQLRGAVLKALLSNGYSDLDFLVKSTGKPVDMVKGVLKVLEEETFVKRTQRGYKLEDR